MSVRNNISVKEQLSGKRILITGATGFLGKVVLEKIIREKLDVEKIILLIRASDRYATAQERFVHEIAVSSIFDRLKDESPAYLSQFFNDKIECVTGEVTERYLGLSPEDFALLARRVDIVIHAAALRRFPGAASAGFDNQRSEPAPYCRVDQESGKYTAGSCFDLLCQWIQHRRLP